MIFWELRNCFLKSAFQHFINNTFIAGYIYQILHYKKLVFRILPTSTDEKWIIGFINNLYGLPLPFSIIIFCQREELFFPICKKVFIF